MTYVFVKITTIHSHVQCQLKTQKAIENNTKKTMIFTMIYNILGTNKRKAEYKKENITINQKYTHISKLSVIYGIIIFNTEKKHSTCYFC